MSRGIPSTSRREYHSVGLGPPRPAVRVDNPVEFRRADARPRDLWRVDAPGDPWPPGEDGVADRPPGAVEATVGDVRRSHSPSPLRKAVAGWARGEARGSGRHVRTSAL